MKFPIFKKSFTLIDVIVGTALVLIVFLGIFAAFQLGMKVVGLSKNKIVAVSLANQQIEKIRNLPYEDVGTIGASPSPPWAVGVLPSATSTILNNVQYDVEIKIKYIVDAADGLAEDCPNDYKRAEVRISWTGRFGGSVVLVTDVAPRNLTEECQTSGGILSVSVFDAYGVMVASPLIEIFNPETGGLVDFYPPPSGKYDFPLATSTYKVVVSKSLYSTDRTYGMDEVAIPEKPNPLVLKSQVTEISLSIDETSTFSVDTFSPWGTEFWSDTFNDAGKISESSNVVVIGGEIKLASTTEEGYLSPGYLISTSILPASLLGWNEFSFTDSEPLLTDLKYQICSTTDTGWVLIPDSDLPGNSQGFDSSPVDLSGLPVSKYPELKIKATASSSDSALTPIIKDWQVSWITSEPTRIPNATFHLKGQKLIGLDSGENPVYKHSQDYATDYHGHINISNLEWDLYTFSIDPATNLDLINIEPPAQPISLPPDNFTQQVNLYLDSQNSLLLTVQNLETLEPVFSASALLSKQGYSQTQDTNEKGQTYFIPLEEGVYNLDVSSPGYLATSTQVSVLGDQTKTLKLRQVE